METYSQTNNGSAVDNTYEQKVVSNFWSNTKTSEFENHSNTKEGKLKVAAIDISETIDNDFNSDYLLSNRSPAPPPPRMDNLYTEEELEELLLLLSSTKENNSLLTPTSSDEQSMFGNRSPAPPPPLIIDPLVKQAFLNNQIRRKCIQSQLPLFVNKQFICKVSGCTKGFLTLKECTNHMKQHYSQE